MSKLIFTDSHITEKAIPELEKIFSEITQYKADELIFCGDYYERKHPNTQEILFGTKWAKEFKNIYKRVIFLRGNHDRCRETSAIDYLKYFGIGVVDDYVDENNNYYAHLMCDKSMLEYGTAKRTVKELKNNYNHTFLGHQHTKQILDETKKIYHLGSVMYINFNESTDKYKQIAILNNNHIDFKELKSPIPMQDVYYMGDLSEIKSNTKVRLIFKNFPMFKQNINKISEWKDKFKEFKIKLDFNDKTINTEKQTEDSHKKLEEILKEGIQKIEDEEVKQLLLEQVKEANQ